MIAFPFAVYYALKDVPPPTHPSWGPLLITTTLIVLAVGVIGTRRR